MKPILIYFPFLALLLFSCGEAEAVDTPTPNGEDVEEVAPEVARARTILSEAVMANGLSEMDSAAFSFRFRDKQYRYQQNGGRYAYERWWADEEQGEIRDVLTNDGLTRYIGGAPTEIPDTTAAKYARSVNSVIYFAFMPWALLDPAAQPKYTGQETIRGEILDRIFVSFAKENGGKDSGDLFHYWFTPDTYRLKYLAYVEPGNKEPRFREAYNERTVDGIVVRDYRNYTTADKGPAPLDSLGPAFDRGELLLLSVIDLEEVQQEAIIEK